MVQGAKPRLRMHSLNGRVRVEGPDQDLDLRVDLLHSGQACTVLSAKPAPSPGWTRIATHGLFLGRAADDAESSGSLSVETHVLGKRLGQDGLMTLGDKVSEGKGIIVDVSRGETLVGLSVRGGPTLFISRLFGSVW